MDARNPIRRPASALRDTLTGEASGGLILMASAALALIVANSPAAVIEAALAALATQLPPIRATRATRAHGTRSGLEAPR